MSQGNSIVPTAYYHRKENGDVVVICPYCRNLHTYKTTGVAHCYESLYNPFSIVAPFAAWQHQEVVEVVRRLVNER